MFIKNNAGIERARKIFYFKVYFSLQHATYFYYILNPHNKTQTNMLQNMQAN
jgi:hypothetical protein